MNSANILVAVNENDFESPGYEYLRSYQNMNNLYYKLIALHYQRDFCALYKCPQIHRYYFSVPSKNGPEQRFLFSCLCAWLIKDKCQMNLELEPEEYEDPDVVIGVIYEALRLLVSSDEEGSSRRGPGGSVGFPPGRLKMGFGPEAIWTMSVLADRALELMFESSSSNASDSTNKVKIVYISRSSSIASLGDDRNARGQSATFITIGQPFVGGGLTTRPLGSYQIDDASLLFDDDDYAGANDNDSTKATQKGMEPPPPIERADPDEWYNQVARSVPVLESVRLNDEGCGFENWLEFVGPLEESKNSVQEFIISSKPILDAVTNRIDRQLQVLSGREKFIQSNLKGQIGEFLNTWRNYSIESSRHKNLLGEVDVRTDKFESFNGKLREINDQIESRIKELNDGRKLKDLESLISQMKEEDAEFKFKIGLLLTVYSKLQAKIVSSSVDQHQLG